MLVHVALGLYAIASRRSLAMSRTDVVQLALGLLTPPLLLNHVVATYIADQVTPDFDAAYGMMLAVYWKFSPGYAFQQLFVVVFVWIHGAIGLHGWLVVKPAWRRIGPFVLPVLFAMPILALVGFAEAGKTVLARLDGDPAWKQHLVDNIGRVAEATGQLNAFQSQLLLWYGVAVAIAAALLAARMLRDRRTPVRVAYDGGQSAEGRRGLSILELSRLNGIPHAHVCSARARCGTCRVRVDAGASSLGPVGALERATLDRIAAESSSAATDNVRLACQARVLGPGVSVTRLLPSYADASAARQPGDWTTSADAAEGAKGAS